MKKVILWLPFLIVITATACQPAAALVTPEWTLAVTPTLESSATATTHPPTATPTQIPPSATATPATPLPPVPTADFSPDALLGTWTRFDVERGNLFLTFSESGRYRAAHGTPDGVVHSGQFNLEDSLLTFLDGWDCSPKPRDTPGGYLLRMSKAQEWLFLDLYADGCPDRPAALKGRRWTRLAPTPAP